MASFMRRRLKKNSKTGEAKALEDAIEKECSQSIPLGFPLVAPPVRKNLVCQVMLA
jgi:hypothetical protein